MSAEGVLIQKSTKMIIKHDLYPRGDMEPVEGMDPDYEWLIKNIPFEEPLYDPRIYIMETNFPDINFYEDFLPHPEYPWLKEYRITYNPVKRSNSEIIASIDNVKKDVNNGLFSEAIYKDEIVFMLAAVLKSSKGFQLTETEQLHMDRLVEINMKLSKNLDNRNLLVQLVNSGQEPNIDSGWERS